MKFKYKLWIGEPKSYPIQYIHFMRPPVTLTISHIVSPAPRNEKEYQFQKGLLLEELMKKLDDTNLISICTTTCSGSEDAVMTATINVQPY